MTCIPPKRGTSLVLASASPRRRELLDTIGVPFEVVPADFDEDSITESAPDRLVGSLAIGKARAVSSCFPERIVLGADTVVVLDYDVLGKPTSEQEAIEMLSRLAGRTHRVYTGVALLCAASGREEIAHEVTEVSMGPLTGEMIERYVASGEPMDKAGAYGIQGLGSTLVQSIRGCYFNVVGLPLYRLGRMLTTFGIHVP